MDDDLNFNGFNDNKDAKKLQKNLEIEIDDNDDYDMLNNQANQNLND
jgi:hypothetical protein